MAEEVIIRVPKHLLSELRELFPELEEESDAVLVRTALRKLLLK